jgi:hypothetical protein
MSHGKTGQIVQSTKRSPAPSLNGKTGSWEELVKISKLKHEAGTENAPLASSLANFVGLWGSLTGNMATIGATFFLLARV